MNSQTIRLLLSSGILIAPIFWMSTIIGGILYGNYSHSQNTVSQLGAIGAGSETLMTIATWLCVALSLCFFTGLRQACRLLGKSMFPLIGVLGFSIMFGWAALFHSGNPLHSKGGITLLLLLAGSLLSAILWKGKGFRKIRIWSIVSLCLMLLVLLRTLPSETLQTYYTGLIQRFVHLGWTVWFIAFASSFLKLTSKLNDTVNTI